MKDEKKYFNQLLHLIDIDRMLHSERKPTLKEMSEKLGVDGRTVSRYLRAMKDNFDAPIHSVIHGSRYEYEYSDSTYSLMDITISIQEANALISARYLLQSIPLQNFYSKTIEGLDGLIARAIKYNKGEGLELQDKIVIASDSYKAPPREDMKFLELTLCEALQKNLPVRFSFIENGEDVPPHEEVYYPLLLTSFHGSWYILAVKNALGAAAKLKFKLPDVLNENDFELINFYDITEAKIIALSKERELPELIAQHENTSSYSRPAQITYDEDERPVLCFGFWFMEYRVDLEYRINPNNGKLELYRENPFGMVGKKRDMPSKVIEKN